jgi:hypothetical protein
MQYYDLFIGYLDTISTAEVFLNTVAAVIVIIVSITLIHMGIYTHVLTVTS